MALTKIRTGGITTDAVGADGALVHKYILNIFIE